MEVRQADLDALAKHFGAQIKALELRILRLENNQAPTIPIYDNQNWPQDAVEGQVVIAPIT